ncbi:uncharacterized protein C8orf48 homolog isoform X1 [Protobothrops mucrosquamatus]|uniref:uncharacterized protein C8orf48 homolog isoform X1 n=1 Tax=Protobothrops mucrosquamatus TaxID=103944 RepID=UPI0010FAFA4F|nr:uncharacterized protein C8orf48 homolog isoform X1 [Protobothrops mucrosquamatus]
MTSWEDESGTSVAEQMGPNCNFGMSLPNYSEDTFTSLSEEEEEDEKQYEDDPFESYDSVDELEEPAASDLPKGAGQSSCQKDEDSAFIGESLTRKWINLLKGNRTITERAKPSMEPDTALPGISEGSEEELGALQSFCASRISHLRRQRISEPLRRSSPKKQRPRMVSERQLTGGGDCAVPSELVNRLHLKSFKEMMKQIAETKMHQPSQCPFCMKKRAEFAEVEFLRRKKTILDNVLIQEKLEDYMYTKDSLTLIGEIHKSLPKLSEDPSIIWQELNKRGWQE